MDSPYTQLGINNIYLQRKTTCIQETSQVSSHVQVRGLRACEAIFEEKIFLILKQQSRAHRYIANETNIASFNFGYIHSVDEEATDGELILHKMQF